MGFAQYNLDTFVVMSLITSYLLTHWGRVMHMCVDNLTIIGSGNGLLPGWCQAIIWANAEILFIWNWGSNVSEILSDILAWILEEYVMNW